ncbi:DUF2262 domain-containing protein [Anaerobiospirillum succiniciproducens]|uniref:DUF2262 domain-containing protein n=1 Tax=Anaerobiospirillum succiniciproducens TaxID=13335 RepID=UPI00248D56EA|nr:DUF2262 domain-containing protein [Anaerobiospirillum succiniciproducens]
MFEDFYEKYETEEHEVFALINKCTGASTNPKLKYWEMSASTIGLKYCATGEIVDIPVTLVWPITEDEHNGTMGFGRFCPEHVYKVKVRKMKAENCTNLPTPPLCVVTVLNMDENCPELMPLLEDYRKEVELEDEDLGTFVLNKDLEMFEGEIDFFDNIITLYLEVDAQDQVTWTLALNAAKDLINKDEYFEDQLREFAAKELTDLANDWRDEDEDDEDDDDDVSSPDESADEITEEEFASRIYITELSVNADGEFTAYYNDDDMFLGHVITINGSLEKGIEDAYIQG